MNRGHTAFWMSPLNWRLLLYLLSDTDVKYLFCELGCGLEASVGNGGLMSVYHWMFVERDSTNTGIWINQSFSIPVFPWGTWPLLTSLSTHGESSTQHYPCSLAVILMLGHWVQQVPTIGEIPLERLGQQITEDHLWQYNAPALKNMKDFSFPGLHLLLSALFMRSLVCAAFGTLHDYVKINMQATVYLRCAGAMYVCVCGCAFVHYSCSFLMNNLFEQECSMV